MKIKVAKAFADAINLKMYKVGEVIDLPDSRAEVAIQRGYAMAETPEKPKKVEKEEAKPVKKAVKKTATRKK